jgi:hypothetical protein
VRKFGSEREDANCDNTEAKMGDRNVERKETAESECRSAIS